MNSTSVVHVWTTCTMSKTPMYKGFAGCYGTRLYVFYKNTIFLCDFLRNTPKTAPNTANWCAN